MNGARGTHGFGFGVTGAELRARIAARGLCPGCVGTGTQWCLHTRSRISCALCAGGTPVTHAKSFGTLRAATAKG
jgi:hypothetical protein